MCVWQLVQAEVSKLLTNKCVGKLVQAEVSKLLTNTSSPDTKEIKFQQIKAERKKKKGKKQAHLREHARLHACPATTTTHRTPWIPILLRAG